MKTWSQLRLGDPVYDRYGNEVARVVSMNEERILIRVDYEKGFNVFIPSCAFEFKGWRASSGHYFCNRFDKDPARRSDVRQRAQPA